MCLSVFLLGFILLGTLSASCTTVNIFFLVLGQFSAIFSSNIFSGLFFLCFPSGIPIMWILFHLMFSQRSLVGFCHSLVGKESACNAGEHGSISGSGRSAGEGIDHSHQYSWASLVAQLVKNLPAMWKIWVQSLGWEDPPEKGKATHSSILAWRIPWTV